MCGNTVKTHFFCKVETSMSHLSSLPVKKERSNSFFVGARR